MEEVSLSQALGIVLHASMGYRNKRLIRTEKILSGGPKEGNKGLAGAHALLQ